MSERIGATMRREFGGVASSHHRGSTGARWRFGLAGFLRRSERLVDGMVSGYERMCTLDDRDAVEIHFDMAEDFARKGQSGDAVASLQQVLARQPNHSMAWFRLGAVQLRRGAYESAVEALDRARGDGLDTFELHFFLGDALNELGRHEEAVIEFEQALEKEVSPGESAEAAFRLGVVLDELERFVEAVAAFKRAVDDDPYEASYHQSLGFALESLGKRDEALRSFKRAIILERRANR